MLSKDRTLDHLIAKVRELTGLRPNELTDDLILAMAGSAENRAYRILEYRKGNTIEDSD